MRRTARPVFVAVAATITLVLSSCGSGSDSGGPVTLKAALWAPDQLPVYQKCAAAFKKETGITVTISQQVFANYWSNLTTQLSAGAGPDVYTLNAQYYAQLLSAGAMLDMSPYLKKDKFTVDKAIPSNALWNVDGKQYSLSQDQDVVGLLYNTEAIPEDTPVSSLSTLDWNPQDGGTFQEMIAHLTIDKNGNRGDSAAFDPKAVQTYGFGLEPGAGITGHASWSPFALSTGWDYLNKNPFGTEFHLADTDLVDTWTWLQKMYKAGFIAPTKLVTSLGAQPVLEQNVVATMIQGSWTAARYSAAADKFGWAQLPSGPIGHPVSITNSIGPVVNPATEHPAEAVKWAEFTVSPTCADIVAEAGVAIPTIAAAKEKALATLKGRGVDTQHWQQLFDNPDYLRQLPITEAGAQIAQLGNVAFDDTLSSGTGQPQPVLEKLDSDVNGLLG